MLALVTVYLLDLALVDLPEVQTLEQVGLAELAAILELLEVQDQLGPVEILVAVLLVLLVVRPESMPGRQGEL